MNFGLLQSPVLNKFYELFSYKMYRIIYLILGILLLLFLLFPIKIYAAGPITGTFVAPDLFYTSEGAYREFFQELHDTGIQTIILMLSGYLSKDCQTGTYSEQIATRINAGNPAFIPTAIKLAKEFNMTVFFSLGDFPANSACFDFTNGDASNEATDKGRLIAMSLRSIDAIKQVVSSAGVLWTDPIIRGFYIYAETDTDYLSMSTYPQLTFLKEVSAKINQKEPGKKILYSPFQKESTDYIKSKQAFTNLYSLTSIDIVAPQDSMGTQLTVSYARSSDHFRALKDALSQYPSKEAWANIESFTPGSDAFVNYIPTTIDKLEQQITASSPYVSKMITWMYSHTMLSNSRSDNMAASNMYADQYTPENALRRKSLRKEYLMAYGIQQATPTQARACTTLYYYHKSSKSCINTSNTYDNNQKDCNGSNILCSTNLQTYLSGLTTGICYQSLSVCKTANGLVSSTSVQTRTPTQMPTGPVVHPSFGVTPSPTGISGYGRETPTPTRTQLQRRGDFTGDSVVNNSDFELLKARFGNPFSIYDYAILIEYYGK